MDFGLIILICFLHFVLQSWSFDVWVTKGPHLLYSCTGDITLVTTNASYIKSCQNQVW